MMGNTTRFTLSDPFIFFACLIIFFLCFAMIGVFLLNIADQIKRIAEHFQDTIKKPKG